MVYMQNKQYLMPMLPEVIFVSVSGPEATKSSLKWASPQAENIDPGVDSVIFQQIDMDYYVGES